MSLETSTITEPKEDKSVSYSTFKDKLQRSLNEVDEKQGYDSPNDKLLSILYLQFKVQEEILMTLSEIRNLLQIKNQPQERHKDESDKQPVKKTIKIVSTNKI